VITNLLIIDQRALPFSITLPAIIVGATLSGRRTSSLGVTRSERQILLSPVGHFLFAASILLPPFALPIVALVVSTERASLASVLIRFQRLLTMNSSSLVFWLLIQNREISGDFSNYHVFAFLAAIATHVFIDALIVTVVMGLISHQSILSNSHWTRNSLLRDAAEVSIGCIGAIFALSNPLLLLIVLAPCCLAVDHLRVNQSAQLGKRDTRTGLLNSFGLQEFVSHEFERAKRHSTDLCLVVLDLDFLRDVNNNYGHQVGDLAISEVARQISALTRTIDGTARIGGEEFVVILPDTDLIGAMAVAERIRMGIQNLILETVKGTLQLTISAGVASRRDGETYSELFDRADTALYESKRLGRNRVSLADESLKTFQANQINTN
jgi:diguanylate cyclase (GGDEF)-like protein